MKSILLRGLSALFLLFLSVATSAQPKNNSLTSASGNYPESFSIQKPELDALLASAPEAVVNIQSNKYLHQALVVMNTKNGDMTFLKLQLSYFKNALLTVQVNGSFSTQVFILSSDKSIFYKGRFEKDLLIMTKCNEDDIVSE